MKCQSLQDLEKYVDYPLFRPEVIERKLRALDDVGIELDELIGKGFKGVVFKGKIAGSNVPVAVKFLRADSKKKNALRKEFILLKLLEKTGVCPVPYFASKDFIIMEFVEGKTLKEIVESGDEEEIRNALCLSLSACRILDSFGVRHSEIKGGKHIIITPEGRAKVIDYESAYLKDSPKNLPQLIGSIIIGWNLDKLLGFDRKKLIELSRLYIYDQNKAFFELKKLILGC